MQSNTRKLIPGLAILLALPLFSATIPILAGRQESPPVAPSDKTNPAEATDNFSGTVTALDGELLSVVRRSLGKDPVTHVFLIDSSTRIEGRLKVKARVTVRYKTGGDGSLHAIYIIVR